MQIAPNTFTVASSPVSAPLMAERPPRPGHGPDSVTNPLEPASASAPAAVASANDGVLQLTELPPIVDFPGVNTGDKYAIVKGSKVGFLGVRGDAVVTKFTPHAAAFAIKAGALGIKVDVTVEVLQTGDDTVRIISRGTGLPDMDEKGRVIASRTNYAEFERIGSPDERTVISRDDKGTITIDTVIPNIGKAHLVLEKA